MLYKTLSVAVYGIDASIIEVEVDVSGIKINEDYFHTVGLPDAAVRESRDRVRAALKNCGYDIPPTHLTINLAPADIRKEGSGFDLPMALGILGAYGGCPPPLPSPIRFDQPPLTCYKDWFCIGPPGHKFGVPAGGLCDTKHPTRPSSTLLLSRVVEACSELRQCAPGALNQSVRLVRFAGRQRLNT